MFCAISGEIPQEPVVSKLSGHVFEKRLVYKYLQDNDGRCPVTNGILSQEDLIALQVNKVVKPRSVATTSVPGLLSSLQNEWDELVFETFTLKQHLDATRQELSQALYQHDAACRVIARLMRERDESRALLSSIQSSAVAPRLESNGQIQISSSISQPPSIVAANFSVVASAAMDLESVPDDLRKGDVSVIESAIIDKINIKCKELSASRKGRKPVAEGILSKESIKSIKEVFAWTPHKTNKGIITCLDLSKDSESAYVLSGSQDHQSIIMERKTGKIIQRLTGHSKKVTDVSFSTASASVLFSASADRTVKMWTNNGGDMSDGGFTCAWTSAQTLHSDEITSLAVHPTGDYVVSMSLDGVWSFLDVNQSGKCLKQVDTNVSKSDEKNSFVCGKFHPDGLILATSTLTTTSNDHNTAYVTQDFYNSDTKTLNNVKGNNLTYANSLKIWDIREQKNVATFQEHNGIIGDVSFSENGYFIATACNDGIARIWDLRKLKCLKNIEVGTPITSVSFDYSGLYLAVGGGFCGSEENESFVTPAGAKISSYGVRLFHSKDWTFVSMLNKLHTKPISGLSWSPDSSVLCSSGADRYIRVCSSSSS